MGLSSGGEAVGCVLGLLLPPGFVRPRTSSFPQTSCGPAAAAGPLVWQKPCPPPHLPDDAISHLCLQTGRRRSGTSGCKRLGANLWQEGLATPQRPPPCKALSQLMAQHAALSPRLSVSSSLVWAGRGGRGHGVPVLWGPCRILPSALSLQLLCHLLPVLSLA